MWLFRIKVKIFFKRLLFALKTMEAINAEFLGSRACFFNCLCKSFPLSLLWRTTVFQANRLYFTSLTSSGSFIRCVWLKKKSVKSLVFMFLRCNGVLKFDQKFCKKDSHMKICAAFNVRATIPERICVGKKSVRHFRISFSKA